MEGFVYHRITGWFYRRGGQRPTKQPPWNSQQLHGMACIGCEARCDTLGKLHQ